MTPRCITRTALAAVLIAAVTSACAPLKSRPPRAALPGASSSAVVTAPPQTDPGFIVVAPDRGFLGNEEVRDAFEAFAARHAAALVFVTDERTRESIDAALQSVVRSGARRVVLLPFFMSMSDPRAARVRSMLEVAERDGTAVAGASPVSFAWGRAFGASYFAVEMLAERLRAVPTRAGRTLVVIAGWEGAAAPESERAMEVEYAHIAAQAADGLGFDSVRAVVASDLGLAERLREALQRGGERPVVVSFHLGRKLDTMMSFTESVRGALPPGMRCEFLPHDITPHPTVAMWMEREANWAIPIQPEEVGVVVLAHGADYHWNEAMGEAVRPLARSHRVELALSMADPTVLERAIRRLERAGARAIVIVRVFALAASFRGAVERLIGRDVESDDSTPAGARAHGGEHGAHVGHHGAHSVGHNPGPPAPRILSTALLATIGGFEDHPFLATVLAERARALSRDPSRETLILAAHGAGDDKTDTHWRRVLASLAERMSAEGSGGFRAIHAGTWREDWPDKRPAAVEALRHLVAEASAGDGRAIVIPARALGEGPERELLAGLDFALGSGFAPHPLFAAWLEEQVREALLNLRRGPSHREAVDVAAPRS